MKYICVFFFIFLFSVFGNTHLLYGMEMIKKHQNVIPKLDSELLDAAYMGREKDVETLLSQGANPNAGMEANDDVGWTPLHYAAVGGNTRITQLLLQYGAQANAQTKRGSTPLHLAVAYNNNKIVEILIANGANISLMNKDKHTPLDLAQQNRNTGIIKLLEKKK